MQAQKLRMTVGWYWIVNGALLFRKNPLALWPVVAGYWLIMGVASAIPGIGVLAAAVLIPPLSVGAMTACRDLEAGRKTSLLTLFSVFRPADGDRTQLVRLLALGAIHFALTMLILGVASLFDGGALLGVVSGTMKFSDAVAVPGVQSAANMALILSAPLTMAFWYAPLLLAWNGLTIGKALFFSFIACWRNWMPFLAYGIGMVMLVLVVVVMVAQFALGFGTPQLVGALLTMLFLLVLAPILFATFYMTYRDVFAPPSAAPARIDERA